MTKAFEKRIDGWFDKELVSDLYRIEGAEWAYEAIKGNPSLLWPEGEESKEIPEPWMTDDDVGALIMEYVPDGKVSIASASEVAVGMVELSFHLRNKAQERIDMWVKEVAFQDKVNSDLSGIIAIAMEKAVGYRTRIGGLEEMVRELVKLWDGRKVDHDLIIRAKKLVP